MSITISDPSLIFPLKSAQTSSSLIKSYDNLKTTRTKNPVPPQYLDKKFQELYLEVLIATMQNQRWRAKRKKMVQERQTSKQQEQFKQCTFQPCINPQLTYNGSNPSPFIKRQMDWLLKKQKKIEDMQREHQKRLKQDCSFHPKISSKTNQILNGNNKLSKGSFDKHKSQCGSKLNTRQQKVMYKEIHMKKEAIKQLQKSNSVYCFNLMTQRRFNTKNSLSKFQQFFEDHRLAITERKEIQKFEQIKASQFNSEERQDYIESIVLKAEEQNTFDSVNSLQLKTNNKEHQLPQTQGQSKDQTSVDLENKNSQLNDVQG